MNSDPATEQEGIVLNAVARVQAGDIEAFSVIVNTYKQLVSAELTRRLAVSDVPEVAQDVFVRAFRALPAYRSRAPFRFWLLQIARYAANDFWRKHYRKKEHLFSELDETTTQAVNQEIQHNAREQERDAGHSADKKAWLHAALDRLTPSDRAVITLIDLEDYSLAEAADELGCSVAAVKVRSFRARGRLKNALLAIRQTTGEII